MAWCDRCEEHVEDSATIADAEGIARCPHCDGVVAPGSEDEERPVRAPWHFKLLAVGTCIYLVYRLIWFIFWLRQLADSGLRGTAERADIVRYGGRRALRAPRSTCSG